MSRRIALLAVFVVLVSAVLILTACGGQTASGRSVPSASSTPSTSVAVTTAASSPTPSPSRMGPLLAGPGVRPGEKPPVLESYERAHTASAASFVGGYFFQAYDWSVATNDTYLLDQISLKTCHTCQSVIAAIRGFQAKHDIVRGGRITVDSTRLITGQTYAIHADYVVMVHTRQSASTATTVSGDRKSIGSAAVEDSLVFISWLADGWKVVEVTAA